MIYSFFSVIVLSLFLWPATLGKPSDGGSNPTLPPADNYLHLYALPVGQGDSLLIQCPSPGGEVTILDMGSSDANSGGSLWKSAELKNFLRNSFDRVKTMIVTHNHQDHYSLINNVFDTSQTTKNLTKIHISCQTEHLNSELEKWIEKFGLEKRILTFNKGQPCGPNNIKCGFIDVCPNSKIAIEAKVLIANWGQQCGDVNDTSTKLNKNTDSIVISLKVGEVKLLLNGDFEDFSSNINEKGPLRNLTDYYGDDLESHVYHISHHGAVNLANKDFILNAVKPKAIFASGNPYGKHRHPRCSVMDRFKDFKTLCKPLSPPSDSSSYCGLHPLDQNGAAGANRDAFGEDGTGFKTVDSMKLQQRYTCGEEKSDAGVRNVTDNQFAIYTTVPDLQDMNLLEFRSDGIVWGFVNHFLKKGDGKKIKRVGMKRERDG